MEGLVLGVEWKLTLRGCGAYFGCSPVECFAGVDEVVECPHGLFHRTSAIRSVSIDEIYIFQLETFESEVSAFDDTLAGETDVIDKSVAMGLTPVNLFRLL